VHSGVCDGKEVGVSLRLIKKTRLKLMRGHLNTEKEKEEKGEN